MATTVVLSGTPGVTVYGSRTVGTPSLIEGGLLLPGKQARITYAPDSVDVHGSVPLAAVYGQGLLTMRLRIEAPDEAAFQVVQTRLEDTVGQFSYTASVSLDGEATTWSCDMGSVELMNGARRRIADDVVIDWFTVTIPVYPIGVPS